MKPEVETEAEVDLMLPEAMVGLCYCPSVKVLQASWMRLHPFRAIPFVNHQPASTVQSRLLRPAEFNCLRGVRKVGGRGIGGHCWLAWPSLSQPAVPYRIGGGVARA